MEERKAGKRAAGSEIDRDRWIGCLDELILFDPTYYLALTLFVFKCKIFENANDDDLPNF